MLTRWVSDVTGRWGDDVKCDMVTWSQSILCCQGQYYYAVRMPGPWAQYRLYNIAAQFSLSWSTHITATSYFCPNLWPRDLRRKLTILWSYFSRVSESHIKNTLYQLIKPWRNNSLKCGGQTENVVCLASLGEYNVNKGWQESSSSYFSQQRSHIRQAGQDSWIPPGHRRLVYGVSL